MRLTKPQLLAWAVAILVVGGAIVISITQRQQATLATTRQPERLTELFFADPTHIPSKVVEDQQLTVSFVIHNLEAQNKTYPYKITFTDTHGAVTPLIDGSVTLANTAARTVTKQITVPSGDGRGEISVELPTKQQSIHFWVERQAAE
ncbi:MAG TPA: hypothetical protein VLG40_01635 [Candidatus Saccharimonas sp.]|nr:hypothetical protein [Candidatus Saccharimonas sp.]